MSHPPLDQFVTFLYTPDLPASTRFYETVLGLPLVLDQGACRIYRVCAESYLGLCHRADSPPTSGIIVTLVSDDVDGWYAHLQAHNIAVEKPPTHNPTYNIYHLFVRDPAGYLVEIQRFLDPAWPRPD